MLHSQVQNIVKPNDHEHVIARLYTASHVNNQEQKPICKHGLLAFKPDDGSECSTWFLSLERVKSKPQTFKTWVCSKLEFKF